MAKIIWRNHWKQFISLLHSGESVKDTSVKIGVNYTTFCKYLRSISIDREGKFKKPIISTPNLEEFFTEYILKEYQQQQDICEDFGCSTGQIQKLIRDYQLIKEWDLKNSTSENVAFGRQGELFIKGMEDFFVLADMIKKDSKAPYDLVLRPNQQYFNYWNGIEKIGAVDVKCTKLRKTESGSHRWKFNIDNVTKPTKYVFALGYDEDSKEPQVLLIIPFKEVKGHSSISISKEKLSESKYRDYVYKMF